MSQWDFEQAQRMGTAWLELMTKMATAATSVGPATPPPDAARMMRSAMFGTAAEQLEQFMRSETFLSSMKQAMDASLDAQKQYQAMLTSVRHQTQGVATQDIDAVMVMLRHLETRVLERLDEVEAKVNDLAERQAGRAGQRRTRDGAAPAAAANGTEGRE